MPVGPLNLDEFAIFIRQATDGYTVHYVLLKERSPVAAFAKSQVICANAISDPKGIGSGTAESPASLNDIEDLRISADKTNLKLEIGQAIDAFLG